MLFSVIKGLCDTPLHFSLTSILRHVSAACIVLWLECHSSKKSRVGRREKAGGRREKNVHMVVTLVFQKLKLRREISGKEGERRTKGLAGKIQ